MNTDKLPKVSTKYDKTRPKQEQEIPLEDKMREASARASMGKPMKVEKGHL